MSKIILFEDAGYQNLLPLVYWRPVGQLWCGRRTLSELAAASLRCEVVGLWVRPVLQEVCRSRYGLVMNAPVSPDAALVNMRWVPEGCPQIPSTCCVGVVDEEIAFVRCDKKLWRQLDTGVMLDSERLRDALVQVERVQAAGRMMRYPWDLIAQNGDRLRQDWCERDAGIHGEVQEGACILNRDGVHLGPGAVIWPGAVIDATEGPVYIDHNAAVLPNAVVQGPVFVGGHSVVSAGAWIRPNTTIGPTCKIGGEVICSIVQGFSNKQHHGFLGHSYVAEWVNLGAGTTTSNLKNTYGEVRAPVCGQSVPTGQMYLGSIVGDFVKVGINQALPTGSAIGFGSSVATGGFAPKFIPSFRFITDQSDERYDPQRCLATARKAEARREGQLSPEEESYFLQLPEIARKHENQ